MWSSGPVIPVERDHQMQPHHLRVVVDLSSTGGPAVVTLPPWEGALPEATYAVHCYHAGRGVEVAGGTGTISGAASVALGEGETLYVWLAPGSGGKWLRV